MRPQINRLPDGSARGFTGSEIDRTRPLRFRLEGRMFSGFVGDTVLSAVLASGVDTLGQYKSSPIGLTLRAHPAISHAAHVEDPAQALSMSRTLAEDGADYLIRGSQRQGTLARLFQPGRSLGLHLDDPHALARPWRTVAGTPGPKTDLLVVGGGVAGLSAALFGAKCGLSVILAEANPYLGGHSGLFGTQDGEDAPEESMARLAADVRANAAITVLTSSKVFSIRPGLARAHIVDTESGTSRGSVIDIEATHIVIATGALERLPLFPGNRLPNVIGTLGAYELATRYGVWPGQGAVVATSCSPAYRLAMLASDAGISVARIFDSRARPASRFVEFSRAYGIVQSPAAAPASVGIARAGESLSVHIDRADAPVMTTERLLVSGGWQPDLTLWHVAGGASQWHSGRDRLEATGTCEGIVLAGSAAGYLTRRGCIASGSDAVNQLLGRGRQAVADPIIDPIYESPDTPPSMAEPRMRGLPTFLDDGPGMLERPAPANRNWGFPFGPPRKSGLTALSESPQPLAVCDVSAGVNLGLIPEPAAGIVAQERVALVPLARPRDFAGVAEPVPTGPDVPAYLRGRYGRGAQVVRLVPTETRSFEAGALIYRSSDARHPRDAVGVVLHETAEGTFGLVAAQVCAAGVPVVIRDKGAAQAHIEAV